jgi:serine/threonine protein kinase/tetratricopeptide (TPR) repeat protein
MDDRIDELAEDFARRWRAGERPSVEEYVERYPQWADEIRAVLPAVVMMERLKPRPSGTLSVPEPAANNDVVPRQVGEYRIVREIGRGGMGVVYEAEQEALGRRVAIKVLPGSVLANALSRKRFRREAQAAARLHHTNIVPVFGVGECDGQCFYVMQLIVGRGLDQVISTKQCLAADAEGDWCRTVARIGTEVADALACAHAQGILHRDIKPSNLLLDERGSVWVTDFGVAKLVEEVSLTGSSDLVGTLKYMPPERFRGQSDTRGDIYSLGVTLYELLTLRSAFPDTTPHHLIHLVTHESPVPPRQLNPATPRDLETIVLKAAARFPSHRYHTPEELAADLRRFLDDRPILAKRTGPSDRAWRWCRRNPALAAATAVALLLMVAVTLVSVIGYVQTAAARGQAERALMAEKSQREHAEHTSTLALEALNRIYHHFAPARMVVTPPETDEAEVQAPPAPTLPPEAVGLLEELLRTYEQLARDAGEFASLRPQAAEANYRIGDIRQRLGRLEDAAAAYRQAVDLYALFLTDTGNGSVRVTLARAYNELGRTLRSRQQFDEAVKAHEQAIRTLNDAPPNIAERPECRYELARAYCLLDQRDMLEGPPGPGRALRDKGPRGHHGRPGGPPDREDGKRERQEWKGSKGEPPDRPVAPREPGRGGPSRQGIQRAIVLLERLVREFPSVGEYRHLLACCYREAPPERGGKGRPGGAKTAEAVALLRKLVEDFPRVPDYRLDLCETLARPGPPVRRGNSADESARALGLEEAISLSKLLVEHYPNVPAYTAARARYHDLLGLSRYWTGKYDEAAELHRKAIVLQSKLVEEYPDVAAYTFWLGLMERSLGDALGLMGQLKEARILIESGVARVEGLWKKDAKLTGALPFLGMANRTLAHVLTRAGEKELAAEAMRKAQAYGPGGGPGPP